MEVCCGAAGWADVRGWLLIRSWKPTLPFKLNQDRRQYIPRQKHKVTNSAALTVRAVFRLALR